MLKFFTDGDDFLRNLILVLSEHTFEFTQDFLELSMDSPGFKEVDGQLTILFEHVRVKGYV